MYSLCHFFILLQPYCDLKYSFENVLIYLLHTRLATAHCLSAIGASTPHIGCVVGPLEYTLRTRNVRWQTDTIAEDLLFGCITWYQEAMFPTTGDIQWITVEASLWSLTSWIIVGTEEHFETTIVIGSEFNLYIDFLEIRWIKPSYHLNLLLLNYLAKFVFLFKSWIVRSPVRLHSTAIWCLSRIHHPPHAGVAFSRDTHLRRLHICPNSAPIALRIHRKTIRYHYNLRHSESRIATLHCEQADPWDVHDLARNLCTKCKSQPKEVR